MAEMLESDINKLKRIYPLLEFRPIARVDTKSVVMVTSGTMCFPIVLDDVGLPSELDDLRMRQEHLRCAIMASLTEKYLDLYLDVDLTISNIFVAAWVRRGTIRGTYIGVCNVLDSESTLSRWQEEAKKSKETGWFLCTAHKKAEPKNEWGHTEFSSEFCIRSNLTRWPRQNLTSRVPDEGLKND